MGHHLPGMIRALRRSRVIPALQNTGSFLPQFFSGRLHGVFLWDLKGIVLVAFIWGVWHGMMQTYGFCRIYDAKVGSFAALTRRLDFALCGIWFATAVLLSSQRMTDTLESYYSAGGPLFHRDSFEGRSEGLFGLALAVSGIFLANFIWMWMRGSARARSSWCFSSPAFLLVVLQQHRGKRSGWHCIVQKCFTMSSTLAGLDLQS